MHGIYIYFKPENIYITESELSRRINLLTPYEATCGKDDYMVDIEGCSVHYLTRPMNYYQHAEFPYWHFYSGVYWDAVRNDLVFRSQVETLCRAMGADEWWYAEEISQDILDELNTDEFEVAIARAPGIENFSVPTFFPAGPNHLFKDSSLRVKSAMD
ncbi:MAG: hypothetical protein K2M94_00320 [Paramuribaculum sp.]|nr:hypothetical protein [Paramuribaculum sp.]